MDTERKNAYVTREYGSLVGKTVSGVRAMTDTELAEFLWYDGEVGVVIEFTDGSFVIVSKDDEGNGAGALFIGQYAKYATARQIMFGE